jgi:hypothetical protein
MVDTNRGLGKYILFTILTFGIYSYWFIYKLAQDVNTICNGDGKQTGGLLKFILLSMITCGIYAWFWYYNIGNRLAENAPRYNLNFSENGTSVLMYILSESLSLDLSGFQIPFLLKSPTFLSKSLDNFIEKCGAARLCY